MAKQQQDSNYIDTDTDTTPGAAGMAKQLAGEDTLKQKSHCEIFDTTAPIDSAREKQLAGEDTLKQKQDSDYINNTDYIISRAVVVGETEVILAAIAPRGAMHAPG